MSSNQSDLPASNEALRQAMELAIEMAQASQSEPDGRPHPLVGAVLTDLNGKVLVTASRGERKGSHAEYVLFKKVEEQEIPLENTILFTTLEPCTKRGQHKIPCAERISNSPIKYVFIGTLDPNPEISGRGELGLQYCEKIVGRFDRDLVTRLLEINEPFLKSFQNEHIRTFPKLDGDFRVLRRPLLIEERNGRLQQTIDLIDRTDGEIWISGGDISWVRELQATLINLALKNRTVRLLTWARPEKRDAGYAPRIRAVRALGVNVVECPIETPFRGTIANPNAADCEAVVLDTKNGHLLTMSHDQRMLRLVCAAFEQGWRDGEPQNGVFQGVRSLADEEVIEALRNEVPSYKNATFTIEDVNPTALRPATSYLEIFKIHRALEMEEIRKNANCGLAGWIPGSPWPLGPIVVEDWPDLGMVLIDGTHRACAAAIRGAQQLRVVVVKKVTDPLPSEPCQNWAQAHCYSTKLPRDWRYRNYNERLFRPLREAMERLVTQKNSMHSE